MIDPRILLGIGRQVRSELDKAESRHQEEKKTSERQHRKLMEKLDDLAHPKKAAKRHRENHEILIEHICNLQRSLSKNSDRIMDKILVEEYGYDEYEQAEEDAKKLHPELFKMWYGFCEHCLNEIQMYATYFANTKGEHGTTSCPHCKKQTFLWNKGDALPNRKNALSIISEAWFFIIMFLGVSAILMYCSNWWSLAFIAPVGILLLAGILGLIKNEEAIEMQRRRLMAKLEEAAFNSPNDVHFKCEKCGQKLVVDQKARGDIITCPACNLYITVR